MMRKLFPLFFIPLFFSINSWAQKEKPSETKDKDLKIKFSGFIQASYQYGEKDAQLFVGEANTNKDEKFSRFGIRRGRVKVAVSKGIAQAVFQANLDFKKVSVIDLFFKINDPWLNAFHLHIGKFLYPFGNPIDNASARRANPERPLLTSLLFPQDRDLGVMLSFRMPSSSPLHFFSFQAGLFKGLSNERHRFVPKDFMTRIALDKQLAPFVRLKLGASFFLGTVQSRTAYMFEIKDKEFKKSNNTKHINKNLYRSYFEIDAETLFSSILGKTTLRGQWIFGKQPSYFNSFASENKADNSLSRYIRPFQGGYVLLKQSFGKIPLEGVFKYDWIDPNISLKGKTAKTQMGSSSDLMQHTLGGGLIYHITNNLKLTAYFEHFVNEKSIGFKDFNNLEKDRFLLYLQYAF